MQMNIEIIPAVMSVINALCAVTEYLFMLLVDEEVSMLSD